MNGAQWGLTPRECEVMHWVAEEKTNWAVGRILGCTEATVKVHLLRTYKKLGVDNRMAAVRVLRESLMAA